ncbi:hypothetical protein KSD_68520 [Ktedonobacter sp. SOSP1-85]|uniref:hypothetical protein n=1 Tax=Ktedonobacter sp. SOSP1-85 TaxID=2778367 RepID=UPI0019156C0E|nr:hypothetical protein [Ktedonobacter sp. SOSP1-85]GHO79081.1 hypothetical protein KSD_68520 [Ktedonobacter sp. SOSP1-85]
MCFAEGKGFPHVHIHMVPKPADLPDEHKGPRIFERLKADEEHPIIPADELIAFCEEFTRKLSAIK